MVPARARQLIKKLPYAPELYRNTFFLHYARALVQRDRSFASHGEDFTVRGALGEVKFFLDIGAHDGISGSNTFYFALRGAAGICFEPVLETFEKLRSLYLFNPRVKCLHVGVSDTSRDTEIIPMDFLSYIPDTEDVAHSDLLRYAMPDHIERRPIRLRTFAEATAGLTVPETVDLVSIDVEGHELNVLRSLPFDRHRFRMIVIETHHLDGKGGFTWRHRDIDAIEALLAERGYELASRNSLNSFYQPRPA